MGSACKDLFRTSQVVVDSVITNREVINEVRPENNNSGDPYVCERSNEFDDVPYYISRTTVEL